MARVAVTLESILGSLIAPEVEASVVVEKKESITLNVQDAGRIRLGYTGDHDVWFGVSKKGTSMYVVLSTEELPQASDLKKIPGKSKVVVYKTLADSLTSALKQEGKFALVAYKKDELSSGNVNVYKIDADSIKESKRRGRTKKA